MSDTTQAALRVQIAPDRLTATLIAEPSAQSRAWTSAELHEACTAAGVVVTPQVERTLAELLDAKRRNGGNSFEIARGLAAVDGEGVALLYTRPSGLVSAGEVIGQLEPARSGSDGTDVCGATIAHRPASAAMPPLPERTHIEQDRLLASAEGYLHLEGGVGTIEPVTVIDKLDGGEQPIVFERTVRVRGNMHRGAPVHAKRSILIDGSIDSGVLSAAHDLIVAGVFGRSLGRLVVGRDMRAAFIKQANVCVGGNLSVAQELFESDITCLGQLIAPNADVRGGRVHAESGMEVNNVGNDSLIRTTLEIGLDAAFEKLLEAKRNPILNGRKHIEQVRMHVAPLMKNPKRLTNSQKEKATELLFEADELQHAIDGHVRELHAAMALMARRAESALVVRSSIHPGTTIRFQGVETTVRSTIQGPCRIVAQALGERPRIVLFRGTSSEAQMLESRLVPQNPFAEMRKLVA